jgi:ABC-type transport system involved in Fe-S cluster assembly fused permease/ATPase subunit
VLNIVQQFIIRATLLGGMFMSARSVVNGELDVGAFVAINAYIIGVFAPLSWLGTIYNAIITGIVDIQNLLQLLAEHPDVTDAPNATPLRVPLRGGMDIEFRDVHFHYPEQAVHRGLQGVSFVVKPGTTTAIVGHTGAGKTTISRLLFRFYDPDRGQILLGGQDIKIATQQSVRGAIGVVPQDTVMFNDTIMYNIRYGRMNASVHEVEQAAQAAQIKDFIESLPEKWNTSVGERGLKLSGGEKQRVAIARCLLKNPPIVLLDEATSALDTKTEQSVQEALHMLGKNRTTLVIAHRLSTIMHADQIIVLDQGRVAERGKHDELLAKRGEYYQLWNMQLRDPNAKAPAPSTAASPTATTPAALLDLDEGEDEVKTNGY